MRWGVDILTRSRRRTYYYVLYTLWTTGGDTEFITHTTALTKHIFSTQSARRQTTGIFQIILQPYTTYVFYILPIMCAQRKPSQVFALNLFRACTPTMFMYIQRKQYLIILFCCRYILIYLHCETRLEHIIIRGVRA